MGNTALIVLDMQKCFITEKTKHLPKKIKEHIETSTYDFIVFSKFINKETSNFVKKLDRKACKISPDIDIVDELYQLSWKQYVVEKNTYSIGKSQEFMDFLYKNTISKLFFCGVDIDACILASVFEMFDLWFDYEILYDISGTSSQIDLEDSAKKIIARNL